MLIIFNAFITVYSFRGGWVGAHVLSSDLAENFLSLAIPHPSVQLEQMVWGRPVIDLINTVKKPMLFMPAKVRHAQ